jgi:hypothetical protein
MSGYIRLYHISSSYVMLCQVSSNLIEVMSG